MTFTDSSDYDIRFSIREDAVFLRKWLEIEGMLHWFPPSDEKELENFVNIWMGFARYNATLTAVYKNQPVGMAILYLMPYRKVAHHGMFQLIVDPQYQRKGIARSLIRNLMHLAKNRFRLELIHAEILDESPLISLLKSMDFTEFARQERYVKEGDQYFPRILMEKDL